MEQIITPWTIIGLAITQVLLATVGNAGLPAVAGAQGSTVVYVAHLSALNTMVTGRAAAGEVKFTIKGDSLTIAVDASGLPRDIIHWQHFHGFPDGRQSTCPAGAADVNGDGIIDVTETGPMAGTTMVPFSGDPVSMDVPGGAYPKALATGRLQYKQTVSLGALQAVFAKTFDGQRLDLDRRVVFIHGIPAATKLPASVASLGSIPAQVTLPIACGTISRVKFGVGLLIGTPGTATAQQKEPPDGADMIVSTLVPLPNFVPGLGTLYVEPVTRPVGPFLAYDHHGNLASSVYMIPLKALNAQPAEARR